MKNFIFILLLLFFSGVVFSQDYENPGAWSTSNSYSLYNSAGLTVFKSADAKVGANAARLESKNAALLGKAIAGVITTGVLKDGVHASGGQPFVSRPEKLSGYYKYSNQLPDKAGVEVLLSRWNSTTHRRDTISYNKVSLEPAADYAGFEIPLTYRSTANPDSQLIVIASSANRLSPIQGSVLIIDDLSFSNQNACVPVSASASDGVHTPDNVLDNDYSTRWSARAGNWLEFCLESEKEIKSVSMAFYNGTSRIYTFDVLTSLDGQTWTDAALAVTSSGTSNNRENFSFNPVLAKYVRIVGHGNNTSTSSDWNSYTEVKINDNITSLKENSTEPERTIIFPNPVSNVLNVSVSENSNIQIFNTEGKMIYQFFAQAGEVKVVNTEGFSDGLYLVKIFNEKSVIVKKIVVKR